MEAIKTVNLSKSYRDIKAVDSLNLSVREGELFSLLGINGAGKSTTIKMLTSICAPSTGEVYIFGKNMRDELSRVKEIIAVSPQETAIAPALSVRENLELICGVSGFSREKSCEKIRELVERFSLGEILGRRAGKLSGGWQRRLSIAMALISEPKILFLDEPTLGLDVIARRELWETIRELRGKITVILTTHYMEEAEALSDRIGIMKNGRLIAVDTARGFTEKCGCEKFEEAFIKVVSAGGEEI